MTHGAMLDKSLKFFVPKFPLYELGTILPYQPKGLEGLVH